LRGVALAVGEEQLEGAARLQEANQAGRGGGIVARRGRPQRTPREVDRDAVGEPVKLGGEGLERGYDKSGVGLAATSCGSGRSAGSLRHAVGVRVDAEHESLRVRGRVSQHEPAVTGSQVHRRRGVGRDELG
jgi:hypothetical protein